MLFAFSDLLGLDEKEMLAAAEGFGSGIKTARTCSAVTGAVMAIGLINSRIPDEKKRREETSDMIRRFLSIFSQKHGSTECRDLLEIDISTPEGHKKAADSKIFEKLCPLYLADAVSTVEKITGVQAPPASFFAHIVSPKGDSDT